MKSGYRHGQRQAATQFTLNLKVPNNFPSVVTDAWILSALEVDIELYKPIFLCQVENQENDVAYLRRLLLTTTIFLQDIKIPVFEKVVIESIHPTQHEVNDFSVDVWFPITDKFSIFAVRHWLRVAHQLLNDVCETLGNHLALEKIVESLHQQHFKPWLSRTFGGKSLIPMLQSAFKLEIPFITCGAGRYILGWGHKSIIFDSSSNALDSLIGAQVSHRKDLAIILMKQAGIPVPYGVVINRDSPAAMRNISHPAPWVVKPVDKDRGEGVTLNIYDPTLLQQAIDDVLKMSAAALVEEQIQGICHRILIVNNQLIFVVKRNPKSVQGDGKHSVRELITRHNEIIEQKIPIKRLPKIDLDDVAKTCLARLGMHEDSIPAKNQKVLLRPTQSTLWGGDPEIVTHQLHPANAEIAFRAAKLFGLNCAGIDFISKDISIPWFDNGAVINEVNYAPVIGRTHEYQRSATRAYLNEIFPDKGRVPIEIYIGAATAQHALQRHQALAQNGTQVMYCHDDGVLNDRLASVPLANAKDTFSRVEMLRLNRELHHLIIHIEHDDSFIKYGLPFDYVSLIRKPDNEVLTLLQQQNSHLLHQYLIFDQGAKHV